jgi:hypothetical protein
VPGRAINARGVAGAAAPCRRGCRAAGARGGGCPGPDARPACTALPWAGLVGSGSSGSTSVTPSASSGMAVAPGWTRRPPRTNSTSRPGRTAPTARAPASRLAQLGDDALRPEALARHVPLPLERAPSPLRPGPVRRVRRVSAALAARCRRR